MLVVLLFIVRTKVSVWSQPEALVLTSVYVPLDVYVWPLTDHVYVSQAVAVVVFDVLLLIVKLRVWVESQPDALVYTLV